MRKTLLVAMAVALAGCPSKDEETKPAAPTAEVTPTAPVEKAPDPGAGVPEGEPTPDEEADEWDPRPDWATAVTVVRKSPTEDKRIPDPEAEPGAEDVKQVSNWIATLYRGETVTNRGPEGEWTRVTLVDETEGWVKNGTLLEQEGHERAAVVAETRLFKRPEITALGKQTLPAGSLLFVLGTEGEFTEVDWPRSPFSSTTGWVRTGDLATDSADPVVAKLYGKAMHLVSRDPEDQTAVWLAAVAKRSWPESKINALFPESDFMGLPRIDEPGDEGPAYDDPPGSWVRVTTVARKKGTDEKRIPDPEGKKEKGISNFVEVLYRGAGVHIFGAADPDNPWAPVMLLPSEDEGWVKREHLLSSAEWEPRVVGERPLVAYDRPEFAAIRPEAVQSGTLIFVGRELRGFRAIDIPTGPYGSRTVWTEGEALPSRSLDEVKAWVAVEKILALKAENDPRWQALAELVRETYPDAYGVLARIPGPDEP